MFISYWNILVRFDKVKSSPALLFFWLGVIFIIPLANPLVGYSKAGKRYAK